MMYLEISPLDSLLTDRLHNRQVNPLDNLPDIRLVNLQVDPPDNLQDDPVGSRQDGLQVSFAVSPLYSHLCSPLINSYKTYRSTDRATERKTF